MMRGRTIQLYINPAQLQARARRHTLHSGVLLLPCQPCRSPGLVLLIDKAKKCEADTK